MGEVLSVTTPVARRQYDCHWCGEKIEAGEKYATWGWAECGRIDTVRVHLVCKVAWDAAAAEEPGGMYECMFGEHCRGCPCEWGRCECGKNQGVVIDEAHHVRSVPC